MLEHIFYSTWPELDNISTSKLSACKFYNSSAQATQIWSKVNFFQRLMFNRLYINTVILLKQKIKSIFVLYVIVHMYWHFKSWIQHTFVSENLI